jgi:hypothetical protein
VWVRERCKLLPSLSLQEWYSFNQHREIRTYMSSGKKKHEQKYRLT